MIQKFSFPKPELFQMISDQEWSRLQDRFSVKKFQANEIIISQGKQNTKHFYIIASGLVEILIEDQEGYHLHISYINPGGYFGEKALLVEGESSSTVIAREDTVIYILSKENFYQFLTEHPDLSRHFICTLTRRLHETNQLLEENEYKKSLIERIFEETKPYRDIPLIINTKKMRQIQKTIEQAATNSLPVLIEGEYGTGKQLIAWQLHTKIAKRKKSFISLDCWDLTEENWQELLFGRDHKYPLHLNEHAFGYLELAEGGTLSLKHCDRLTLAMQENFIELIEKGAYSRLGSQEIRKADVQIIASTREDLEEKVKKGNFHPKLYSLLQSNYIQLPPLRERKKGVPHLAKYFLEKYAHLENKEVTGITQDALNMLVSHDYKLANVGELEQIIARAVPLSSDDQIWPRHLFLGPPAVELDSWYYNLLKIKPFSGWVMNKIYPDKLQYATATFFILLMLLCFFGPRSATGNPAILLVWGIWWPAMFLSFFWVGRSWCSICAYAAYGRFVQKRKHFNLPFPTFIVKNDAVLVTIAFLTILWAEEITHMRTSPLATGCLMLTMLSLALICAMVFRREGWCRYLCPMGGLIGVCSMSSILELRSNTNVCQTQCKKTECYNGTEENPGCPMFQHLLFVDNNQTCKLCLKCIRNCPNQSVSLNLRLPGREIWLSNQVRAKMSFFVCALLAAVIPVSYLTAKGLHLHSGKAKILFTFAHFLLPIVIGCILWLPNFLAKKLKGMARERFWRTSYAYVPVALTAHIVYQLQYLPGGTSFHYFLQSANFKLFQGPIIQPFQVLAFVFGLLFSWFCLWQIFKHRGESFQAQLGFWLGHGFLMAMYAFLVSRWLIFK